MLKGVWGKLKKSSFSSENDTFSCIMRAIVENGVPYSQRI